MNKVLARKPPSSFWIISIVLLLWNGMGATAYFMQVTASQAQLADVYSPAELAIIQATPSWAIGAFAIAVFGGLLGAIGLLLRKSWARVIFAISFVAVLIQHIWTFFLSDFLDIVDPARAIMPIIVVVICVFEIWYAGNGIKRGWLR